MTQKTGFYIAAIFFAIAAVASFIAGSTGAGIVMTTLTIVFGVLASTAKPRSTPTV